MFSESPSRVPNLGNGTENMRKDSPYPIQGEARSNANSKSLSIARLGVQLHVKNGKAVIGGIDLSRGLDQELVFSASASGDDPEESCLEVFYHLNGGFLGVQPFWFVVGYQFLWLWHLHLLRPCGTVSGFLRDRNRIWGWRLLHSRFSAQ